MKPAECQSLRPLLAEYCDGELAQTQRDIVEEHVAGCRECGVELSRVELELLRLREALVLMEPSTDFTRRVMDDVRALVASTTNQAPPRQFTRKVMELVRSEAGVPEKRPPRWRGWVYAAAAASVVFGGAAVMLFRNLEPATEVARADFLLRESGRDLTLVAAGEPRAIQPGQTLPVPARLGWQATPVTIEASADKGEARFQLDFGAHGGVELLGRGSVRLEQGSVRVVRSATGDGAAPGDASLRIELPSGEQLFARGGEVSVRLHDTEAGLRSLLAPGTKGARIEVTTGTASLHLHESDRPLELAAGWIAILEPLQPVRVFDQSAGHLGERSAGAAPVPPSTPAVAKQTKVSWLGFDVLFDTVQVLAEPPVAEQPDGSLRIAALPGAGVPPGRIAQFARTYAILVESPGQAPHVVYGLPYSELAREQTVRPPASVRLLVPLSRPASRVRVELVPRGLLGRHWRQVELVDARDGSIEVPIPPGGEVRWWEGGDEGTQQGFAFSLPPNDPRLGVAALDGRIVLGADELRRLRIDGEPAASWTPGSRVDRDRDAARPVLPPEARPVDLRLFLSEAGRPVSEARVWLRSPGRAPWLAAEATPQGVAFLSGVPADAPIDVLAVAEESGRLLVAWQRCEPAAAADLHLEVHATRTLRGWVSLPPQATEAIEAAILDGLFSGRETAGLVETNGSFVLSDLPPGRLRLRLGDLECEVEADGAVPPPETWRLRRRR